MNPAKLAHAGAYAERVATGARMRAAAAGDGEQKGGGKQGAAQGGPEGALGIHGIDDVGPRDVRARGRP